jgi:seryl-tRNA synthetase
LSWGVSIVKILCKFNSSNTLFITIDNDIKKLKKEEKEINKKIKATTKILKEYKKIEKEYVSNYSQLCTKYNDSKAKLDEIENTYFNKTKKILNDLKTYNIYTTLNSLSKEDREYILKSINNNFLNYQK